MPGGADPADRAGTAITQVRNTVLSTLVLTLLIVWLAGFGFHVGGNLIHLLLAAALILLVYRMATGSSTTA